MTRIAPARQTRLLLWAGFGGLVVLLTLSGVSALSVLRQIQIRNQRIREDYVKRDHILEQVRSGIYLSGTYVRDFLLETNDARAERHRADFESTRQRIEAAFREYQPILYPAEVAPFQHLSDDLRAYFDALRPALRWDAAERRARGFDFMREQILPRRATMISLADQVGDVNTRQLEQGNAQVVALFQQFRQRLVLLLSLTLGMGIVLAGISLYRILQLERESEQRYREIVLARHELQELSARLVNAQEQERRTISRELHDEVGQSLSALLLGVGNLANRLPQDLGLEVREHLQVIRRLAEKSVSVVRNMSLLLRPSMLDDLGLLPALQWQAREVSRTTNLQVSVAAEEIARDLPEAHKSCVYRIVQEALHNCSRHAHARTVHVNVHTADSRLLLSIQDDGRGFEPAREKGLGLLGMEERVTHLGGSFHVRSGAGAGTLLSIDLPLPPDSSPAPSGSASAERS